MDQARHIGGRQVAVLAQLFFEKQHLDADVLFAIAQTSLAAVDVPSTLPDILRDPFLVDPGPALDVVGLGCVEQPLARALPRLVRLIGQQ